jgi:hypothetical protein
MEREIMSKKNQKSGPQRRSTHKDRLTLKPENVAKIENWITHFRGRCPAVKVKPQDVVNEILEWCAEHPSKNDLERLSQKFFDEVLHLEWVLAEAKKARSKGESFDVKKQILGSKVSDVRSKKKASEKRVKPQSEKQPEKREVAESKIMGGDKL